MSTLPLKGILDIFLKCTVAFILILLIFFFSSVLNGGFEEELLAAIVMIAMSQILCGIIGICKQQTREMGWTTFVTGFFFIIATVVSFIFSYG